MAEGMDSVGKLGTDKIPDLIRGPNRLRVYATW
jgi:hypothetical protein